MNKLPENRIAVIGIGNEFCGDDGAGIIVAREIIKRKPPEVDVIFQNGECTKLIEAWKSKHFAIIVDASSSNSKTGTILRFNANTQKLPASFFNHSTHAFSVTEAIKLARVLNCLPPELIIYTVEGANFKIGSGLSVEVKKALKIVCRNILTEIHNKLSGRLKLR
jgi:hydrogenase maturation protease